MFTTKNGVQRTRSASHFVSKIRQSVSHGGGRLAVDAILYVHKNVPRKSISLLCIIKFSVSSLACQLTGQDQFSSLCRCTNERRATNLGCRITVNILLLVAGVIILHILFLDQSRNTLIYCSKQDVWTCALYYSYILLRLSQLTANFQFRLLPLCPFPLIAYLSPPFSSLTSSPVHPLLSFHSYNVRVI